MSGFAEAHVREELGDQPVDAVLHKPFTTAQLLSALAGVGAVGP